MIKIVLTVIVVIVVVFLIAAALQPSEFRVARSVVISAPPAIVFTHINDLHKWQEISPYAKLDLAARYAFDGPAAGPGATLSWAGNSKMGEGRMSIVESRPPDLVRMKLDFIKPFASTCAADFTFLPERDQTSVTWSMTGPKNFISKAVGLVMNMDKMLGGQFEEGLANLKHVAEAEAKIERPSMRSPPLVMPVRSNSVAPATAIREKLDDLRTQLVELAFTLERRGQVEAADVAIATSCRVGELYDELAEEPG